MLTSPLQQASSKNGNPWLTGRSSGFFKKQTFTNLRNSCYSHSVYYQNTRSPIDLQAQVLSLRPVTVPVPSQCAPCSLSITP